jgi:hypothetical protein
MSDLTPIEILDDAVRAYVAALDDHNGELSSWALCSQTTKIEYSEDRMPLMHQPDLTSGPSTSPATALGLLGMGKAIITNALFAADDED